MGMEYELKFAADPQTLDKIKAAHPLAYTTYTMRTTYYDTADHALSARHITLRLRQENDELVCTVKTPLPGYGRGEWECNCDDIVRGIEILCQLGAPAELLTLTDPGVTPVCGAEFWREAGLVTLDDAVVELALDRGKLLGGSKDQPLCEVEVELKSGCPETAVAFALVLSKKFGLQPEPRSKFRRAMDLAKEAEHGL